MSSGSVGSQCLHVLFPIVDMLLSLFLNAFSLLGPAKTQFPISSKEGVVC